MPISPALHDHIVKRDKRRCCYCWTSEYNCGSEMHVDHIIPASKGGPSTPDNLCAVCFSCNTHKQAKVQAIDPLTGVISKLFHPLQQHWQDHFAWDEGQTLVIGLTACGRATIASLVMNNETVVRARRRWVNGGWHPPTD